MASGVSWQEAAVTRVGINVSTCGGCLEVQPLA